MFTVTIGKVPGAFTPVVSDEPITVRAAAELATLGDLTGYDVRVNGQTATLDTQISATGQVLFVKNAKGNC